MGVGGRAAMAGHVLENRQDAPIAQSLRDSAGNGRHFPRLGAIGAITDHRICPGARHIGDRQAIDVDAQRRKIGGDQAGAEPGGGKAGVTIPVVERAIGRARRIARPVRRTKALNAPALLVDQDRGLASKDRPRFIDQPA